jgi:hypothetical protein
MRRRILGRSEWKDLACLIGVASALMVFGLAMTACSDSTGTGGNTASSQGSNSDNGEVNAENCVGPFCAQNIPNLELDPSETTREIFDNAMSPGDTEVFSVGLVNTGAGILEIEDITLDYVLPAGADDEGEAAFELQMAAVLPLLIYPDQGEENPKRLDLQVRYTRKEDGVPREARLRITSNDEVAGTTTVTFTSQLGTPQLSTDRKTVDFELVPDGEVAEQTLNLINSGSRILLVSGFKITQDGRFGVKGDTFEIGGNPQNALTIDLNEAIVVPQGELMPLTVTFTSDSPSPAEGKLLIYSDDPTSGVSGYEVSLTANKSGPCIDVSPRTVAFGGKVVGTVSVITVEVKSCGSKPLTVSGIALADGGSSDYEILYNDIEGLDEGQPPSPTFPLQIPVNEWVDIPLQFVPDAVNPKSPDNLPVPDEATLIVESDAFESVVEVPISGAGAEEDCPVAKILIEEGEEVIPQTVLHLDATQSYAPFGGIKAFNWSVEQPDGSQEFFVPSPSDPQPVFAANVVGLYTFQLVVYDENNTQSCKPAVYQVIVQPDQAIHVELTWITENDEDETDSGENAGSDLDLHFTHPNATTGPDVDGDGYPDPWFDDSWDCFWYNQSPNWGSFDPEADDDPSLDRDDTDGAGPENLNISIPEGTTEAPFLYTIGAHYWDDHGFGEALATVKVFTYATEIFSESDVVLNEKDMWCVGKVQWPEPVVTPCSMTGGEPIVPDYVHPNFLSLGP